MSNLQVRAFSIMDFSGGLTDNNINAPLNRAETVDNFFIRPNKSIQSRFGSHVEDAANAPLIPGGNQRISNLINYDKDDSVLYVSAEEMYHRPTAAYMTLTGPSGNDLWANATTANHTSTTQWKRHVFLANDVFDSVKKVYKDSGGTLRLRTAGLPQVASDPTITPTADTNRNYIYAFVHFYEYTAGNETFQDFGPTRLVEVTDSDDPGTNQNDITAIPVLANGADESWDTTVIKVKIYRTINNGSTLFEIGEVTNGTTVFTDNFADTAISDNTTIYTNDGSLDNDPPPTCKFVHVVGDVAFYAHTKEGTDTLSGDVRQSVPGDPDSCPASLRDTLDDEITGISSIQSIPIVFCRKFVYRLDGLFDAQGRGGISHVRIDDTAGCVSNNSIVQAEDMVFWCGNDGFYASDGYKVVHISDHFNDRYSSLMAESTDLENIYGSYDEKNGLIFWAMQSNSSSGDNDIIYILDLRWGVSRTSSFTTMSGGSSFRPSSIAFFNEELYRADSRGYMFVHSSTDENDPLVNTGVSPSTWDVQPVIWTYKGITTDFGNPLVRKWVPRIKLSARNVTNVTIGIFAENNDDQFRREVTPIRYRRNFVWGDPEFVWGDADFVWGASGLIEQQRRLPKRGLRCSYMQVEFTNAYAVITNSDNLGTATVDATANTVTLDNAATTDWPVLSVGYFISFEEDGYVKEYEVTARTADVLTVLDPSSELQDGSSKWLLRGYRKSEVFNLLGYTLSYGFLSRTQSTFEVGEAGLNT